MQPDKLSRLRPKPSIGLILFFLLIFTPTVFQHFTIWKLLALLVLIGSLAYGIYRNNKLRKAGEKQ